MIENWRVCSHVVAIGAEAEPGTDSQRSKGTFQGQGERTQKDSSFYAPFLTISIQTGFFIGNMMKHVLGGQVGDLYFTSPTC